MNKYSCLVQQVRKNRRALDGGRIILWSHLGLGDQISASRIVERISKRNVEIIWPVKPRNFDFLNYAFQDFTKLSIVKLNENSREDIQVAKLAIRTKSKVVSLGHARLSAMSSLFPEYALNSLFNLFLGIDPLDLVSQSLRKSLLRLNQEKPPKEPFAFVDHHPGSAREIPCQVLWAVQERGLRVIENPRGVPLYSMVELLDSAQELHLVNSAPLCLALAIDAAAQVRIHYDSLNDPVTKSYRRWTTFPLTTNWPTEIPRSRNGRAAEEARLEILFLSKQSWV